MTPDQAAHILEPVWLGLLAARLRLAEQANEAEKLTGREAASELEIIGQAKDYLEGLDRRFSREGMTTALALGNRVCLWPVSPSLSAYQSVVKRYLSTRPDAAALLERGA